MLFVSGMPPTGCQEMVSVLAVYAEYIHAILFGDAFDKGQAVRIRQTHARHLIPTLLEHIGEGRLNPWIIITRLKPLADAAEECEILDKNEGGSRKPGPFS